VAPTSGRLPGEVGTLPDETKLEVFGGGELSVHAGGDILGGLYYAGRDRAGIQADGSIVSGREIGGKPLRTLFALGDAGLSVRARGNLEVESVFNPTMFTQAPANLSPPYSASQNRTYFFTYGEKSAADFMAVGGNVLLQNTINQNALKELTVAWKGITGTINQNQYVSLLGQDISIWNFYPSSLRVAALAADIKDRAQPD
jgi:filamentous hemagglutinin